MMIIRSLRFILNLAAALFLALALLSVALCAGIATVIAIQHDAPLAALGYGAVVIACATLAQMADL